MSKEINLTIKKDTIRKEIRKFFLFSVLIFILVFSVSAIIIIYSFILTRQTNGLIEKQNSIRNEFSLLSKKKIKFLLVKNSLNDVQKLIDSRLNLSGRASKIIEIIPENIDVLEVSVKEKTVELVAESRSLYSLNLLLENLYNLKQKDVIARVELGSFNFAEDKYMVNFNFEFSK